MSCAGSHLSQLSIPCRLGSRFLHGGLLLDLGRQHALPAWETALVLDIPLVGCPGEMAEAAGEHAHGEGLLNLPTGHHSTGCACWPQYACCEDSLLA